MLPQNFLVTIGLSTNIKEAENVLQKMVTVNLDSPMSTEVRLTAHAAACSSDDFVYVSGLGKDLIETWLLNCANWLWKRKADLKPAVWKHSVVSIDGKIYILGGLQGNRGTPQKGTALRS